MAPKEIVIEIDITEMINARLAYRVAYVAALVALCLQAAIMTFLSVVVWRHYEGLAGAIFIAGALGCQGLAFAFVYRDLQRHRRRISEAWRGIIEQIRPAMVGGE